ncbi:MAG: hypothetical protein ACOYM8_18470 [Caulobacterales bacterium]
MLTVVGPAGGLTETIAQCVSDLLAPDAHVGLAIVDAWPPAARASLEAMSDADIEASCVQPLAELAGVLSDLAPNHRRIVLIGSTSHLGAWDCALAAAYSAGAVGLMRSVALEFAREGLTINLIAAPAPDLARAPALAALCAALLQADGVSGQAIPCDGGENLRMIAARPRRSDGPSGGGTEGAI